MNIDTLRRLLLFGLLTLTQAFVFNRIQLFQCATPLLYVYFIVMLPHSTPHAAAMLWGFFLGLATDMFANTPGMATASMTLLGAVQPLWLGLFLPRDVDVNMPTAAKALGWDKYSAYAAALVTLYCLVFFAIEAFSTANIWHSLACAGSSALLTTGLIFTFESIRK